MAAEIDLDRGGEPAQGIALALADEESRLGEVVLGGDRLQRRIRQPFLERHDGRRIAGEDAIGEGVDLIDRQAHAEAPSSGTDQLWRGMMKAFSLLLMPTCG